MTRDTNDGVSTDEDFANTLKQLLRAAHDNGVDVEGAWLCRNGDGAPDWEANVVELEKRND
ncbi:hypothetical protein ACKVMT_16225 [Halobacteriales archaeon Cl-PHB]